MKHLVLLLVLMLPSCAVRPIVQLHNCTVYTFTRFPAGLYWTACDD